MRVPLPPRPHLLKRFAAALAARPQPADHPVPLVLCRRWRCRSSTAAISTSSRGACSAGVAGEIAMHDRPAAPLSRPGRPRPGSSADAARQLVELAMRLEPGGVAAARAARQTLLGPVDEDLAAALARAAAAGRSASTGRSDPDSVLIRVQLPNGVLRRRRRRASGCTPARSILFVLWLVGSSLLLFGIAALFMRNQVRAIRRLAVAAEAFGMGRDPGPIRAGRRHRGAPGGRRVQPHAGAHPPLPAAAHRDAGRRVARPAHAADPAAAGAGDAAGRRGAARRTSPR